MLLFVMLFSCAEPGEVELEPQPPMDYLKIEEVFYSGSVPTEGIDRYYADQFIQLRNTSDYTLDIGGMGLGDVFGLAVEVRQSPEGCTSLRPLHPLHCPRVPSSPVGPTWLCHPL